MPEADGRDILHKWTQNGIFRINRDRDNKETGAVMIQKLFYKKGQLAVIIIAVSVFLGGSGETQDSPAENNPVKGPEEQSGEKESPAGPDILKQKALEKAQLRLEEIKEIYSRERERLRDELKDQLNDIKKSGNDRDARRLAVQEWKKQEQALKAAYQTAYSECQKTIADLGGDPGASVRRVSAGTIQILKAPAGCPRKVVIKKRCPRR